jgi:two-component system, NarL family, nitrate/nitrite response regulator NarL
MRRNESTGEQPRLLVGDKQPLVASALAALLIGRGYDATISAGSGADVEAAIGVGDIDIVILDIDLAGPTVLDIVAKLRQRSRRLPVVVIAPDADHPALPQVIAAGVDGIILKSQATANIDLCLTAVIAGGQWFDRNAMVRALDSRHNQSGATLLTRRERDVARLVATGQRNRNIAGALGISEGTVKMHLHNVYAKMGVESRTQLAMDERLRMLN